ncbi:hypothetical protein L1887_63344 [Cichorium endivia]|nr:hypothetical protein L1887_63344 [Cichorium endivia]
MLLLNEESDCRQKLNRSPSLLSDKIIINIEPSKDTKKKTVTLRDFWNGLRNAKSSTIVQKQEIEYVHSKKNAMTISYSGMASEQNAKVELFSGFKSLAARR